MPSAPAVLSVTGLSSTFGLGSSLVWFPDPYIRPFAIGVGCIVNSTAVVYNVEHAFDYFGQYSSGINGWTSSQATWFQNTGITGATTNANGNYAFPVTAIRLNVTAGSSTGTVTGRFIQAG
jgi:hypothetical protein